ncbi:hypothetical protein LC608_30130 [Nostoc sp. XA010]|uniref:hypothetical protein n=1 Tax=Nostoc sp. XA010 TaxID=2780407 RepID=UPI001E4005E6|nr:hypothetical protein [Nostoc sp. XA010]MCC5661148.1 hypothetical protein [Nostoc sp. XA010]
MNYILYSLFRFSHSINPSTQSTAAHLSAVEQIRYLHILKLQHHASTLTTLAQSIAHLLQQRSPAASRG